MKKKNPAHSSKLQRARSVKHGMRNTSEWHIWAQMKGRCQNVNNRQYPDYGGRGITVCKKWQKFEGFFEDMGHKPKDFTLERIDVNEGYNKENCMWIHKSKQSRNRRNVIHIENLVGAEFARKYGLNKSTLYRKLREGWEPRRVAKHYGKAKSQNS